MEQPHSPLVSVVVPVYNVEAFLAECLDSVLAQTFGDYEVICVNDGSTDGSREILLDYAKRDARIRIVEQANGGLSAARNAGMDQARGVYVYFLDSDDKLRRDALCALCDLADRESLDQIVFTAETFVAEDADESLRRKLPGFLRYYSLDESLCNVVLPGGDLFAKLVGANSFVASIPLRFLRLSVVQDAGLRFPGGLLHEDAYFAPISLCLARRAIVLNERYFLRRLRAASIMTSVTNTVSRMASLSAILLRLSNHAVWGGMPPIVHSALIKYMGSLLTALSWHCEDRDDDFFLSSGKALEDLVSTADSKLFAYGIFGWLRGYRRQMKLLDVEKSKAPPNGDAKTIYAKLKTREAILRRLIALKDIRIEELESRVKKWTGEHAKAWQLIRAKDLRIEGMQRKMREMQTSRAYKIAQTLSRFRHLFSGKK